MSKPDYKDIEDLSIHPRVKDQPRLTDEQMLPWRKEMKRAGEMNQKRAVLITEENEIVDGRHWYWCCKKLGWKKIRYEIVPQSEVMATIFNTLVNRRHYSKGQLAFIVAKMVDDVFAEAKKRMLAGSATTAFPVETPESIAANLGISTRVLQQAQEIHQFFDQDKTKRTLTDRDEVTEKGVTFREFFEPRILMVEDPESPRTRAYGLGAVLAGIKQILSIEQHAGTRPHSGGRPERVEKQLQLFSNSLSGLRTKFDYWQKWDEDTRSEAAKALPPVMEKMPDDLLAEFAKAIKTELKRREK